MVPELSRRMLGVLCAVVVGAVVGAVGCTDSPDDTAVTGNADEVPAALSSPCGQIAAAQCSVATSCCNKLGAQGCVASAEKSCADGYRSAWSGFATGAVKVVDDAVNACVNAIHDAPSCQKPAPDVFESACGAVVVDIATAGKQCAAGVVGLACASGNGVCIGTTKGAVCLLRAAEGQTCGPAKCTPGLRCVVTTSASIVGECRKPGPKAAPCGAHADCAVGLACSASQTCLAAAKDGQPCAGRGSCDENSACDDTQGKCVPRVHHGENCLAHAHCHSGLLCAGIRLEGTCAEQSAIGASCNQTSDCAAGLHCDINTHKCTPQTDAGQTCSTSDGCSPLLYCDFDDKRCKPLPGEGKPCAYSVRTCLPGLTCYQPSKTDRTCVKHRKKGEKCSQQNNCMTGLGCKNGVCVNLPGNGSKCLDSLYCKAGWCDHEAQECKAWHKVGEACHGGHECGPKGACVGTKVSDLKCVSLPAKDQACLLECQPGLFCATKKTPGTCETPVCVR